MRDTIETAVANIFMSGISEGNIVREVDKLLERYKIKKYTGIGAALGAGAGAIGGYRHAKKHKYSKVRGTLAGAGLGAGVGGFVGLGVAKHHNMRRNIKATHLKSKRASKSLDRAFSSIEKKTSKFGNWIKDVKVNLDAEERLDRLKKKFNKDR